MKRWKKAIAASIVLGGVLLFMYPYISNYLYNNRADSIVREYHRTVAYGGSTYAKEVIDEAREYNECLFEDQVQKKSCGDKAVLFGRDDYEEMMLFGTSVMAILEVPSINLRLPVFPGDSEEVLKKGLGHLKGTSLPVGGKNTHAVITGHTGMNTARLFSDLINVSEGELFFIEVGEEKLAYKVCRISVVKPEDTTLLEIVPDKDLVTLVTCTPYGVNSHRLLVRGERTQYHPEEGKKELTRKKESQWGREYLRSLILGACTAMLIGTGILVIRKKRCRKR